MEADEYIGKRDTVEDILIRAEAEGVKLGTRQGRITARGCSPVLTYLIKEHEKELVEHLGGKFDPAWM